MFGRIIVILICIFLVIHDQADIRNEDARLKAGATFGAKATRPTFCRDNGRIATRAGMAELADA